MNLTFSQWVKLGFGGMAWMNKHRDAVDDAIALWQSIVPAEQVDGGIPHTEAIEKVRTGDLSADEKAVMDRASQSFG